MNNNLEFDNENPDPNSVEDNHPRTNYGEGYSDEETIEKAAIKLWKQSHPNPIEMALFGANWQEQRSYNEQEVGELLYNVMGTYAKHYNIIIDGSKLNELFNEFKKK